jgi:hypothetical protein
MGYGGRADKFDLSHAGVKKLLLSAGAGQFAGLGSKVKNCRSREAKPFL